MTGTIVVVGDTLLDRDVEGVVNRLCPDSPVPVLDENNCLDRPGGAGLAALFAAGRGYDVALVTALADDEGGARLSHLLTAAGVQVYGLPLPGATPEKIRLRTRGRVLLRHDRGGPAGSPGEPSDAVLDLLAGAAGILVSDYGRGVARLPALRAALAGTVAPIVWDPHPRGPAAVPGVRLATPNEVEARELAGLATGGSRLASAARYAQALRQRWRVGAVVVTMGGEGALLCHAGSTPLAVPSPTCADGDTCGAGDRFAATATVALAGGALVSEAVQHAVAEASEYVAAGGVASAVPAAPARRARSAVDGRPAVDARSAVDAPAAARVPDPTPEETRPVPDTGAAAGSRPAGQSGLGGRPAGQAAPGGPVGGGRPGPVRRRPGNARHTDTVPITAVDWSDRIGPRAAGEVVARVRAAGGTVVATGGCFDLLHAGHVATLEAARQLGDCLVVCVNSDESVAGLKGPDRPLVRHADRARLLAALGCVDAVVVFDESTPHAALSWLRPDIWVKGGDYGTGADGPELPEAEIMHRWGGHTVVVPYLDGRSTTGMIAAARTGRGPVGRTR
ncbi:PfkB family carbohydrate kinase [Micromonospora sp. WMMD1102]|uniref:PfkB family carbohydrate kinase n=1 Tax=Micromonospora sp. WMMD1102 TaxID=3016105 RepID=UPI002414FA02|nr:PfkB family carbohydrate kinase [Micromonospora sp. WMMD1102]MDG4788352.1 PfkB family carbohydrate kinase [Micromonospora sp. WMMD1102]